jgi:pimeloyl-ACP methyl ester carboxylesterase
MATARAARPGTPTALERLAARFDPDVIDVPPSGARIRIEQTGHHPWDARVESRRMTLRRAADETPDALLRADPTTWEALAADHHGGMQAFRTGDLEIRHSLHHGVGFLAATSGDTSPGRLAFATLRTRCAGPISMLSAGTGPCTVVCLHGLGGTKASFLSTVAALSDSFRVVALDLPGFGESHKPIAAPYDAEWFARAVFEALDALGAERAHLVGNSMGGRVAIEAGLLEPDRVGGLVLLSPALAWLRDRRFAPLVRALRPELGLLQLAPRPVVESVVRRMIPSADNGWAAAGIDEFLRAYLTPRGRAAFYAAARNIYLDEPHGDGGFWTRLGALEPRSLFVWGRKDMLVPIGFMRHVERELPRARHLELDCGHVPQLERPAETHRAMREFFDRL